MLPRRLRVWWPYREEASSGMPGACLLLELGMVAKLTMKLPSPAVKIHNKLHTLIYPSRALACARVHARHEIQHRNAKWHGQNIACAALHIYIYLMVTGGYRKEKPEASR